MSFPEKLQQAPFYYFGYGSNLSIVHLKKRLNSEDTLPERVGVYVLEDYEFAYNLEDIDHSVTWANVMPKPGSKVYGLVSEISSEQLEKLDTSEDVPRDYIRKALQVKTYFNESDLLPKELYAFVYIGADPSRLIDQPKVSPAYEKLILDAAEQEKLPEDYICNYLKVTQEAELITI